MTAVEWLIEELMPSIALQSKYIEELKEQANKIFEQQILDAILFGMQKGLNINKVPETDGDWVNNYYTSTYGSKGSDEIKTDKL